MIGAAVIVILFGSAMLSMAGARFLREHHLSTDTRTAVSVSVAVVGTLSAIVVGLLLSTANASFTAKGKAVTQISADVIGLDRLLRRYGPDAQEIRLLLRRYTAAKLQDLFPEGTNPAPDLENPATVSILEALQDRLLALAPTGPAQRWLRDQALQITAMLMATRWELGQESAEQTPFPFIVLVLVWFVIIFASFGLFAPRNFVSITAIFLCAFGIGTAIRTITELESPFRGLIRISGSPLTQALVIISD